MAKLLPSPIPPIRGTSLLQTGRTPLRLLLLVSATTTHSPSLSLSSPSITAGPHTHQVRHATLIRRPQRPYTFTQLVQLSDGSTFTMRTTSPHALYRSAKDTRNHARWQPSEKSLRNVEVDEAGKLAAFRGRYGRGWDAARPAEEDMGDGQDEKGGKGTTATPEAAAVEETIDLTDLIGGYAEAAGMSNASGLSAKEVAKQLKSKGKKGKK